MAVSPEAWGVIGAFVVMAVSNNLAMKKFFGGKDNKELSDTHPTYVSPDGLTFAVWGLIYLTELILVVAQAFPSEHTEGLLAKRCPLTGLDVRQRLICVFCANAVWLPVFNNECFWIALGVMAVYFGFLLSVYSDLNVAATSGFWEAATLCTGIGMNTSWIVVAFMLSVFFCGGTAGWQDQHGVAGNVPVAALVVIAVAALGCERALRGGDLGWAFVAGWACRGIYRMQTIPDKVRFPISALNSSLGSVAGACSIVVFSAMLLKVGMIGMQSVNAK
mmetsp:Transcript_78089/g.198453  ORF Transcript_78089/g.198453 Transcript_78089/m.198453 type:complete len:276 (-) Transcript_78089:83-910(-)